MSRTVWKYPIPTDGGVSFMLDTPSNFRPVHVAMQGDRPHLWAEVEPEDDDTTYAQRFTIVGTGDPSVPWGARYVGTWHTLGLFGLLVFHLYWVNPPTDGS